VLLFSRCMSATADLCLCHPVIPKSWNFKFTLLGITYIIGKIIKNYREHHAIWPIHVTIHVSENINERIYIYDLTYYSALKLLTPLYVFITRCMSFSLEMPIFEKQCAISHYFVRWSMLKFCILYCTAKVFQYTKNNLIEIFWSKKPTYLRVCSML
jgi:hypothetical protein